MSSRCFADASSQQPGSDGAPEISQATQTHIVMPATSALPRIFCNVANPPSSSYPHQPNATSASFESQPATNATPAGMHQPHSQQSQCKLEHSMSSDMTYQPITIKPELEDSRRSERIRHAVITSGHAPSFGGEHSGMCQTQHAGTDHFRVPQSQPTLCATRDQQSGHVPPPLGSSQHFDWSACLPYQQPQQQAAGSHVSWQHYAPADALNNYPYQRAFSQPFDAASGLSAPHDQLLMSPKMFSEQELIAWRLLPQQLPHLEELSDFQPNGSMHLLACQPQPDCQDIAEGLSQECMHDTSGSLSGMALPSLCIRIALGPLLWDGECCRCSIAQAIADPAGLSQTTGMCTL